MTDDYCIENDMVYQQEMAEINQARYEEYLKSKIEFLEGSNKELLTRLREINNEYVIQDYNGNLIS